MALGLKPMGKLATPRKIQVLDRTKVLHGPRTQTYGETSYFKKIQVLDRTKVLHSPRTQTYGKTNYSKIRKSCGYGLSARSVPRIIGSAPTP